MFRLDAKRITIFLLLIILILLSIPIYFFTEIKIPNDRHVLNKNLILEKGSLLDQQLLLFFVKAGSNQNDIIKIKNLLHNHAKDYNKKKYLVENVDINLSLTLNSCLKSENCLRIPIKLNEISGNVWRALIGIEDSRFLTHQGLDWISIFRAFLVNLRAAKIIQGGSTLTQQLAKNLFFSTERTITRKLKEAFYSMILELKYSKLELIEAYLNNVYWGSYKGLNIYGIKAASVFYFSKHPNDLDEFEASILIGMLKGPSLYSPFNSKKSFLIDRSNLIYKKLIADNFFTGTARVWTGPSWESWFKTNFGQRFLQLKSYSETKDHSFELFSLSYFLNKKLVELSKNFPKGEFEYQVIGQHDQNIQFQMSSNLAILNQRKNIGSLLKPIVYSIILENSSPDEMLSTEPITFNLKSGKWTPSDHYNETKLVSLKYALLKSLNIPYLRKINDFGFIKLEENLKKYIKNLKLPLSEFPAQLLGSAELTMDELKNVFTTFFNGRCTNKGIEKVYQILSDPSESTTANWAKSIGDSQFFGKTGTSNNGYDNWYVFHDSRDFYIIWMGHIGKRDVGSFALSGAGVSFDVLQDFLTSRAKNIGHNTCD